MKRVLPLILVIVIFLAGIGMLSYPLISSVINNIAARQQADFYVEMTKEADTSEIDAMFEKAQSYNDSLHKVILTDPFDAESYGQIGEGYTESLDIDGNGLIGYVDIPKINVYLPIYHGTSLEILQKGAGHLEQTSLPIGGKGSHSVISAHSAFPGETFFDYLTDMEIGDEFYIHVLDRTLKYVVDDINVVLPEDVSKLYIDEDKDYVTLLTCTPYSVNTHRLLVRGVRAEYQAPQHPKRQSLTVNQEQGSVFFLGYKLSYLTIGLFIGGFLLAVALIIVLFVVLGKKKNTHRPRHGEKKR